MDTERLLRELAATRADARVTQRPWLAMLLAHGVGIEEGVAALTALHAEGRAVAIWVDAGATWHERLGEGWRVAARLPHGPEALGAYRGLLLPVLPLGLCGAIVAGDDRDERVRAVLAAVFAGLPVAAVTIGVRPDTDAWRRAGFAAAERAWLPGWSSYLWQLRRLGIQLLRGPQAVAAWATTARATLVVGEGEVLAAAARGERIVRVPARAVVTPLAFERAREHQLEIRKEGEPR